MNHLQPTGEDAARKRKAMRRFICFWGIGGGVLFIVFGRHWLVNGLPVHWLGYLFILLGILGLAGMNVFRGGPLDLRLDQPAQPKLRAAPEQPKYTLPPSRTDEVKCKRLKDELAAQPEPRIVSLERFFDGNDDVGSIGCNLSEHPGMDVFRDTLMGLVRRPDIEAVYAQITELDPGEGSWPFTDTLFVVGKISAEELQTLLARLEPDEVELANHSDLPASIQQKHRGSVWRVWWD